MRVEVGYEPMQNPQTVRIELPDWHLGGARQVINVSVYEALEIHRLLGELFARPVME